MNATALLTGGQRSYFGNASMSADDLWNLARSNSLGGRTFNPMTCWTYSSGDASPDHVNYSDANIVGSHCYTVLGWAYQNGAKYIILRNPWGNTEATVQTLNATVAIVRRHSPPDAAVLLGALRAHRDRKHQDGTTPEVQSEVRYEARLRRALGAAFEECYTHGLALDEAAMIGLAFAQLDSISGEPKA